MQAPAADPDALPPGFPPVPCAGRLDADTEGLLLFSGDGRLLQALVGGKAKGHVEKEYEVDVAFARPARPGDDAWGARVARAVIDEGSPRI